MDNIISEKTLIPLSLLIVIAGGVFWLSTMYAQATVNAQDIRDLKTDIKQDLRRIENKLDKVILEKQ